MGRKSDKCPVTRGQGRKKRRDSALWRQRLEWCVHKSNISEGYNSNQKPTPGFLASGLQDCERTGFCYSKLAILWQFVDSPRELINGLPNLPKMMRRPYTTGPLPTIQMKSFTTSRLTSGLISHSLFCAFNTQVFPSSGPLPIAIVWFKIPFLSHGCLLRVMYISA